ncbi:hypothetical protein NDU88_006037 [Pleurodeles waltl]|uniref:Uncharacterized protein n=1 Tax=Pleurodeles waltl TaxID=8319 RepID=A0AAV7MBR0_PLEWA|nr:hypothetical protein NDU88_006037 [Pleurodeles waltl]
MLLRHGDTKAQKVVGRKDTKAQRVLSTPLLFISIIRAVQETWRADETCSDQVMKMPVMRVSYITLASSMMSHGLHYGKG